MLDLQVVFPQNILDLSRVRVVETAGVRTLDIHGEDFAAIDEVRVNDIASPSFVVLSSSHLLAQVPDQVVDRVTSVTVLTNRIAFSARNLLRFRFGRTPSKVGGMLRLIQLFIKLLFTTPGTDIWNQESGGGALRNLGRNFDGQAGASAIGDFQIAVDQTTRQIIAMQARNTYLPLDERLLRATVLSVYYNRNEGALVPSIELLNQTGQPALVGLTL